MIEHVAETATCFLLTKLVFCGNLFQQFNITYLLRVPARLPKEPEQVFDFLIAT